MHHEITIYSPATGLRYLLLPRGAPPAFPGQHEELGVERAQRVLLEVITSRRESPDWKLLHALGVTDHPANLARCELEAQVARALLGIPRLHVLQEPARRLPQVKARMPAAELAPAASPAALRSYVGIEVACEAGKPLTGVCIELTLPDGSVCTLSSDQNGQALVTGIAPGACKISLPRFDASCWQPSVGTHRIIGRQPAKAHVVQQGECLSKIAHQYGFHGWEQIWNDAANEALKSKRKSPHVLLPGDEVMLPGIEVAELERPTDAMHGIVVNVKPREVELVLTLKDGEGEPLKEEPYELTFLHAGEKQKRTGSLDGAGTLREQLPVTVNGAQLSLDRRGELYAILLGHLDPGLDAESAPIETGAIRRLQALGFVARAPGEEAHLDLRAGIMAFQEQVMGQAEPTGELDAATCARLEELYGA